MLQRKKLIPIEKISNSSKKLRNVDGPSDPKRISLEEFFSRNNAQNNKEGRTSTPSLRDDLDAFDTKVATDSLFFSDVRTGLEMWWIKSHVSKRLSTFFILMIFLMAVLHLLTGLYLLVRSVEEKIEDPYVCKTEDCDELSDWLRISIDENVDPCDDFYHYVCGKYNNTDEIRADTPLYWDMTLAKIHKEKGSVFGAPF